jgi:hypothetical protein
MRWATDRHHGHDDRSVSGDLGNRLALGSSAGRERILVLAWSAQSGLGHPGIQPATASRAGRWRGRASFRSAWRAPRRRLEVEDLAQVSALGTVLRIPSSGPTRGRFSVGSFGDRTCTDAVLQDTASPSRRTKPGRSISSARPLSHDAPNLSTRCHSKMLCGTPRSCRLCLRRRNLSLYLRSNHQKSRFSVINASVSRGI